MPAPVPILGSWRVLRLTLSSHVRAHNNVLFPHQCSLTNVAPPMFPNQYMFPYRLMLSLWCSSIKSNWLPKVLLGCVKPLCVGFGYGKWHFPTPFVSSHGYKKKCEKKCFQKWPVVAVMTVASLVRKNYGPGFWWFAEVTTSILNCSYRPTLVSLR